MRKQQQLNADVVKAARDLRYTAPRMFAQLVAEHPELAAEASKHKPSLDARGVGSASGYEPYRCWDKSDRGRYHRMRSGDDDPDEVEGSLIDLHQETDGGYTISEAVSRPNQLEVCRLCGSELKLSRDGDGLPTRDRGRQPEYCSAACRREVKEARARAKRRKPPKPDTPSLDVVEVAGAGDLGISPEEWNRLNPRNNPEVWREVCPKPAERLPYLHRNARSARPQQGSRVSVPAPEYQMPAHRLVQERRRSSRPKPPSAGRADRIARRFGTGGTPRGPQLTPGWDAVTTAWRFPQGRSLAGSGVELVRLDEQAWSIAQTRT